MMIIFSVAIGFLFIFLNTSNAKEKNNSEPILEIVSIETAKNTTTEQVLQASDKVTQDLQGSNGFIKRTLTQNTNNTNQWVDIIDWQTIKDDHSYMDKAVTEKDLQEFLKLMKNCSRDY
ncbi:EbhA protein [Francisella tularensis]|uniref:EbhA protein n=1 Tax=Francisella tularensis TaxID=263 RepID=UPI0029671E9E|nr:EbhA protein [Francisella tularensis]